MNLIKILPDFIANQIAAGEVVQRPESVVKELVENSIDAGATEIAVFIKNAGKQLIHIIDNGSGMSKEDLELSIKRHATSKVFTSGDLEAIRTYGFRGEALASIASVALIEIRTKTIDNDHGWKLISEPNSEPIIEPINCDKGTQIFIRNLFYNIPARRKFLRTNLTEFRHISETMFKFALSNPTRRFTFYDDNHIVFDLKPSDLKKRISDTLGDDFAVGLLSVDYDDAIVNIQGFVSAPDFARKSSAGQYLFLNGRAIINKNIAFAIFTAFDKILEKNLKPQYVLNLSIDHTRVDINVHPQKHEAKFDDEVYIHNAFKKAILQSLEKNNIVLDNFILQNRYDSPFERINDPDSDKDYVIVNTTTGEIIENEKNNNYSLYSSYKGYEKNDFRDNNGFRGSSLNDKISAFETTFREANKNQIDFSNGKLPEIDFEITENDVWQFNDRLFFLRSKEILWLFDILRCKQRIQYENFLMLYNKKNIVAQDLLFPMFINLNNYHKKIFQEIEPVLCQTGFKFLDQPTGIQIVPLPIEFESINFETLFSEILDTYSEYKTIRSNDLKDNIIAAIALKSVKTSSSRLNPIEIKKIIEKLFACNLPFINQVGKKTIIPLYYNQLLDFFKS